MNLVVGGRWKGVGVLALLGAVLPAATAAGQSLDGVWRSEGYGLVFETRHEGAAKAYCFDEMLRPNAEEYEPTPWTVES